MLIQYWNYVYNVYATKVWMEMRLGWEVKAPAISRYFLTNRNQECSWSSNGVQGYICLQPMRDAYGSHARLHISIANKRHIWVTWFICSLRSLCVYMYKASTIKLGRWGSALCSWGLSASPDQWLLIISISLEFFLGCNCFLTSAPTAYETAATALSTAKVGACPPNCWLMLYFNQ